MSSSEHLATTYKPFDRIAAMNEGEGSLTGYDCRVCKNKGVIYYELDGYEMFKDCDCMEIRRSIKRIEKSGLKNALKKCTFENFKIEQPFQEIMKSKAIDYINDSEGKWFFVGGQVGCGKTHICTAIVRKFLTSGKPARYMQWRDEIGKIKANANSGEYEKLIEPWKAIEILYIDDLFKTEKDKRPTTADINVAFEILNYRYRNSDLITIISSERSISEIIDIDEGVGSRIFELSRGYCTNVDPDRQKNYRLRGIDE